MTPPTSIAEGPHADEALATNGAEVAPPTFHLYSFLIGLLTSACLLSGSLWLARRPTPPAITLHPPPTAAPTPTQMPTPTPAPITVFVSGAVASPGLYALDAESRVGDALRSAGGLTAEADPAIVNQAEPLWDGAQIHVPVVGQPVGDRSVDALLWSQPPSGVSGSSAPLGGSGGTTGAASGKINVNTADAMTLQSLPGIGPSKAEAIIANRPYQTVDELERVPGIGPKTVDQLREQVATE